MPVSVFDIGAADASMNEAAMKVMAREALRAEEEFEKIDGAV